MFLPGASGDTAVAKTDQVLQFLSQESIDDDARSINLSASAGVVDTAAASKGAEDLLILAEVARAAHRNAVEIKALCFRT